MKNYEFKLIFRPDAFLLGATFNPSEGEEDWHELNVYMLFVVFHFKIFV